MSTSKRSTTSNGDNGSKRHATSKVSKTRDSVGASFPFSSHTPIETSSPLRLTKIEETTSPAALPPTITYEKGVNNIRSVDNMEVKGKKEDGLTSGKRSRNSNDEAVSEHNERKKDSSSPTTSSSHKKKDKKQLSSDIDNSTRIAPALHEISPSHHIPVASSTKSEGKNNHSVSPPHTRRANSTVCQATALGSTSSQSGQSQDKSPSRLSNQLRGESTTVGGNNKRSTASFSVRSSKTLDIISSKALSAYAIGVSCMAISNCQTRLVIGREDGSLQLFNVIVPKRQTACLIPIRTMGSPGANRTISKVVFAMDDRVVLVAYLSGQVMVLDAQSLTPHAVMERSGGAVWDLAVVPFSEEEMILKSSSPLSSNLNVNSGDIVRQTVFAAVSNGTWHQLVLEEQVSSSRSSASFAVKYRLYLFQVCPKLTGSNRAISVVVCSHIAAKTISPNSDAQPTAGTVIVGGDDLGNLVAWHYRGLDQRAPHTQLWTARLPKGGYAKTIAYSSNTCTVAAGTSLGDVVFLRGGMTMNGGTILASFTHHRGPISALICTSTSIMTPQSDITTGRVYNVNEECFYATGWHESLRCYRYQQERWHPAEVKRRTHYHEATCLSYLPCAGTVLSGARDATVMMVAAGSNQRISAPKGAKYINITQQPYAFARNVGLLATICGAVVEIYKINENMNHWAPFASYTVSGEQTLTGIWCDDEMSVLCVSNVQRISVVRINLSGRTSISMEKIVDIELFGVMSVIINEAVSDNDKGGASTDTKMRYEIYILSDDGLTHLSAPRNCLQSKTKNPSVGPIISTIHIPDKVEGRKVCYDSLGMIDQSGSLSLIIASSSVTANGILFQICINKDGSLNPSYESGTNAGWSILSHAKGDRILSSGAGKTHFLGLVQRHQYFIDICPASDSCSNAKRKPLAVPLPTTLPPDTVFIARIEQPPSNDVDAEESESKYKKRRPEVSTSSDCTLWMGYCPKGLLFATHRSWWMMEKSHQSGSKTAGNNDQGTATASFRLEPRTTFVNGFQLSDTAVLMLERDIEAEVESLPLMWKVRRFAN